MEQTRKAAAPVSGDGEPSIEEIMADPEIAALLEFEPVPRKQKRGNSWTPELQRMFVALIAHTGSRTQAANALGREVGGASKLCQAVGGEPFADACDAALDLYHERNQAAVAANPGRAWGEPLRARSRRSEPQGPLPGQRVNEMGEYEDEESFGARAEEAKRNTCNKLLRIRRLFLQEICTCPGKRAAFEILTELPIDWDKAKLGKAQADEPYRNSNQREKDMVLLAESGWSFGELGYGPDRKAQARAALDDYRAAEGLPAIPWGEEAEDDE